MGYVVIAIIIISLIIIFNSFQKKNRERSSFSSEKISIQEKLNSVIKLSEAEVDTTEDNPVDFGYKISWLAIRTTDQMKVANSLGAQNILKCNWNSGIDLAYSKATFITPPIDGWILVVNFHPIPDHESQLDKVNSALINLSKIFGEVQLFATHRVAEFHCWVKVVDGKILREYSYSGDEGKTLAIKGTPTEIEKSIKLVDTFSAESKSNEYWNQPDLTIPNEELVIKVAASWSINPTILSERKDLQGLGLVF